MYTAGDIRWGYNIYVGVYIYSGIIYIPRYVVVSWFLPCMGFVPGEGCTIPCTLRQVTCTDRLYKANHQISIL